MQLETRSGGQPRQTALHKSPSTGKANLLALLTLGTLCLSDKPKEDPYTKPSPTPVVRYDPTLPLDNYSLSVAQDPLTDSPLETPTTKKAVSNLKPTSAESDDEPINWAKWIPGILVLVGAIASLRGFTKAWLESKAKVNDLDDFVTDRSLSRQQIRKHLIYLKGDILVHRWTTYHRATATEIFDNEAFSKYFKEAANMCTPDKPLITPNFEKIKLPLTQRFLVAISRKKMPSAFEILERYNQIMTDYYAEETREGFSKKEGGHPVTEGIDYIISCCDVGKDNSRKIVHRAISRESFELFGDPAKVALLKQDNPRSLDKIKQLEIAYQAHREYLETHPQDPDLPKLPKGHPAESEPGKTLFPWAVVWRDTVEQQQLNTLKS